MIWLGIKLDPLGAALTILTNWNLLASTSWLLLLLLIALVVATVVVDGGVAVALKSLALESENTRVILDGADGADWVDAANVLSVVVVVGDGVAV